MVGWHTKRRCHLIHDNNLEMHRIDPQQRWMNPADADARGIGNGSIVYVLNERGRIRIPVNVTERIMPGVVALSQGAWLKTDQDGIDIGGSINVLTSQHPTPLAKGNPQHTNRVEVEIVNKGEMHEDNTLC